jgi:carboxypeptidase C (cathepsin A)
LGVFFSNVLPAADAPADAKPAAPDAEKKPDATDKDAKEKEPKLSVTDHEITINGKTIKYRATAGYMAMKDAEGDKTKANIFFIAYTKIGVDDPSKRPLTFSFNGGPGSASIWLHMGALGPKRVAMTEKGESLPPPYKMVDNEFSWLDQTDLVFIDPVSTGFSRPAKGEKPEQFHGFKGDVASVGDFIRLYMTRNERWSSPKFIIGESYGTTRASALSNYLQDTYGIYLNGIVLLSSVMNFETIRFAVGNDLPYSLFVPTYAAGAWYHHRSTGIYAKQDLPTVLKEAETFVQTVYTPALMLGDSIGDAKKKEVAQQLSDLIGIPEPFVEQRNLRINIFTFTRELLKDKNRSVGRYDERLTGIRYEPGTEDFDFDPSYEAVMGGYSACFNDYVRRNLKYESDLPYNALTAEVFPWDYSNVENEYLNTAEMMHQAMSRNTHLKVWIANGHYDLATPYFATEYTVQNMGLDPEIRGNISLTFYEAGHMVYMVPSELAKFKADSAHFYETTLHDAGVN